MQPGEVRLPPTPAVPGGVGVGVMGVVPALTKGDGRDPGVITGAIATRMGGVAPAMGGGIDKPGGVVHEDQAQGDPPQHQRPTAGATDGADPEKQASERQLQDQEPLVQPAVIGVGRQVAAEAGHGHRRRNGPEHPTHVAPPEAAMTVVMIGIRIRKLVVVPMQAHPINRPLLAAEGAAGGKEALQPAGHAQGAMAEQTVVADGHAQAGGQPVENQQAGEGSQAPESWQQSHQGQGVNRGHEQGDAQAQVACAG